MAEPFGWDGAEATRNRARHAVSFVGAATAFAGRLSLTVPDRLCSEDEERFVVVGRSVAGRLLVVVHTDRGGVIRIISAREATPRERRQYAERP